MVLTMAVLDGTNLVSSNITDAISNAGSDLLASVSGVMGTVVPAGLAIMALVMSVTIAITLFKKITKSGAKG